VHNYIYVRCARRYIEMSAAAPPRPVSTKYELLVDKLDIGSKCLGCDQGLDDLNCVQVDSQIFLNDIFDDEGDIILETEKGNCYSPGYISTWWDQPAQRDSPRVRDIQTRMPVRNKQQIETIFRIKKNLEKIDKSFIEHYNRPVIVLEDEAPATEEGEIHILFNNKTILSELGRLSTLENTALMRDGLQTVLRQVDTLIAFFGVHEDAESASAFESQGGAWQCRWWIDKSRPQPRRSIINGWRLNSKTNKAQFLIDIQKLGENWSENNMLEKIWHVFRGLNVVLELDDTLAIPVLYIKCSFVEMNVVGTLHSRLYRGDTPDLRKAVENGNMANAQRFMLYVDDINKIQPGPQDHNNSYTDHTGNGNCTLLHIASTRTQAAPGFNVLPMVQLLLDNGADKTVSDSSGMTPLHSAASLGLCDVATLLLSHGADVVDGVAYANALDSWNMSPLTHALLWANRVSSTVGLEQAFRTVELLIKMGADVNIKWTVPHVQSIRHLGETVYYDFVYQSDSAIKCFGQSLLHLAATSEEGKLRGRRGFTRSRILIDLFLAAGARPNAADDNGDTPLHYLTGQNFKTQKSLSAVCSLLMKGADPLKQNKAGLSSSLNFNKFH
jgi:ankyrin repeat protein